jgi:hypothetical protein
MMCAAVTIRRSCIQGRFSNPSEQTCLCVSECLILMFKNSRCSSAEGGYKPPVYTQPARNVQVGQSLSLVHGARFDTYTKPLLN